MQANESNCKDKMKTSMIRKLVMDNEVYNKENAPKITSI